MSDFTCVDCPHESHFERARRLLRRVHLCAEPESVARRRGAPRILNVKAVFSVVSRSAPVQVERRAAKMRAAVAEPGFGKKSAG
jgi:hypothetical protein